jgi:hypothetical protein
MLNYAIVFIPDEGVYGEMVSYGLYASRVRYEIGGVQYDIIMLNEDFEIIEEANVEEIEEI